MDKITWLSFMHLSMSSRQGGGGGGERRGIGQGFDRSLWPEDRVFKFSSCPGDKDI